MRVIRPAALATDGRRRALLLALSMLASGVLAAELVLLATGATVAAAGILADRGRARARRGCRPTRYA